MLKSLSHEVPVVSPCYHYPLTASHGLREFSWIMAACWSVCNEPSKAPSISRIVFACTCWCGPTELEYCVCTRVCVFVCVRAHIELMLICPVCCSAVLPCCNRATASEGDDQDSDETRPSDEGEENKQQGQGGALQSRKEQVGGPRDGARVK